MPNGEQDSASRLLLVEGSTDEHVARHIRIRAEIPDFKIESKGGKDELLNSIPYETLAEDRVAFGVMLDANGDPAGRWQAIMDRFRDAGIEPLPSFPQPEGVVIDSDPSKGLPRVGVWMMPDNKSPGELEDFLKEMLPPNDAVWPLAQAYICSIPPRDRKFHEGKTLRAQVHAWLAAGEDPRPPGQAIGTHDLAIGGPLCVRFTAWLRDLFGEPPP